jgi:hypothetical protein
MDELYIVNSVGDPSDYVNAALNQDGQVELDWFCHSRSQPIAPYHTLITDYAQIQKPNKENAERYMDELFTRAEASLFIPYLSLVMAIWSASASCPFLWTSLAGMVDQLPIQSACYLPMVGGEWPIPSRRQRPTTYSPLPSAHIIGSRMTDDG